MLWIVVIVALLIAAAALAYVVWPLFKPGPAPLLVEDDQLTALLGRKDAVMQAIKDLEFDYRVGKLSEEDFQQYDQRLRRQAVALLQQIDQVAPETASVDAAVEAQIAGRRKVRKTVPAVAAATNLDADLEAQIAARRKRRATAPAPVAKEAAAAANGATVAQPAAAVAADGQGVKVAFCTNCGNALEPQHKFCANCGTPVVVPAAAQS
jgi:cell division protein FtsN